MCHRDLYLNILFLDLLHFIVHPCNVLLGGHHGDRGIRQLAEHQSAQLENSLLRLVLLLQFAVQKELQVL